MIYTWKVLRKRCIGARSRYNKQPRLVIKLIGVEVRRGGLQGLLDQLVPVVINVGLFFERGDPLRLYL